MEKELQRDYFSSKVENIECEFSLKTPSYIYLHRLKDNF